MSCSFCERKKNERGSDGSFGISKRVVRHRDGSKTEEPVLEYNACTNVFGTDVELNDHLVIRHCPMCGKEL